MEPVITLTGGFGLESGSGTNVGFVVTLSEASQQSVTVSYRTVRRLKDRTIMARPTR